MQYKSRQKFIRTSPRKLREVASMVRELRPAEAIDVLPHVKKRAATPLLKAIKTAVANAVNEGADESELKFKVLQINDGPKLPRWRAGARGRVKPYRKRLSHIRVVLETDEEEKKKSEKKKKDTKTKSKKKETKKKDSKKQTKKKSKKTKKKGDSK